MYLTKSDFKVARTCPTKLYYKKLRYPSLLEDNPFLEFLADGGYMVEAMAKLLYPGGVEIGHWDAPSKAFEATKKALLAGDCVLLEATVVHGTLLARTDILRREGNTLHLIEVKSSSYDSETDDQPFRGKRGGITAKWKPYLEDVTFQAVVLSRAFPDFQVHPWLCVVDKARTATAICTFDRFKLVRMEEREGAWRPSVTYEGDPSRLVKENLLAFEDVSREVAELRADVETAADDLARTIVREPPGRVPPQLGYHCKKCEYRLNLSGESPSGFRDCWRTLAIADPHILDLYRVDLVGGKARDVVAEMAASGLSRLADVPTDAFKGATAFRQEIQLHCTANGDEYLSEGLKALLAGHPYPLHFIDFEASRCALPYHEGMHPYELAAFQWSCHTISAPGAPLEHTEWLNDQEAFPNFDFARSLMNQLGESGTFYMWHHYERSVLKAIREQMDRYGERDPDLAAWLERLTADGTSRLVDLCALAKEHYFHPTMKGSLSIKNVLPTVWETDPTIRERPEFAPYDRTVNGRLLNPYETLEALPYGDGEESVEAVKEGTAAVRTYQEMMFGRDVGDPDRRMAYRKLLLQYCALDTAAMVIIWMHWRRCAP